MATSAKENRRNQNDGDENEATDDDGTSAADAADAPAGATIASTDDGSLLNLRQPKRSTSEPPF